MASRPEKLEVWLYGEHVADLTQRRRTDAVRCRYTQAALDRWDANLPILSCSLPLGTRPHDATAFFEGLLPEGEARNQLAADRKIVSSDTYMMLAHFGRDVAGALQVVAPGGEFHTEPSVETYRDGELADQVARLHEQPLAITDTSELSLPGLQDKMTLVRLPDGRWGRPVGGHPSTHILKVEDRRYPGLVSYEAACLGLARVLGLTNVDVETVDLGGLPCLIVSRYDRRTTPDGDVVRVHQEDLCQATGVDPTDQRGLAKYERHGGPSFVDAARLLRRHSDDTDAQLAQLIRAMTYTVAIGNADAHGKNLALLHVAPGTIQLAPLYDTVPTRLFPPLRNRCAMHVNGIYADIDAVCRDDLISEVVGRRRWGMTEQAASAVLDDFLQRLHAAATTCDLPSNLRQRVLEYADALRPSN